MSKKFNFMSDPTAATTTKPLTKEQYLDLLRVVEESIKRPIVTPHYNDYMDNMVILDCGTKENAERVYKALKEETT